MPLFYARGENPLALPAGDEPADAYGDEEDGCYSNLRKAIDGALVSCAGLVRDAGFAVHSVVCVCIKRWTAPLFTSWR